MLAGTVYNNVISTLQNNPALSAYIKRVFKGLRYKIEPNTMPCIAVEPVQNNEIEKDYGQVKNLFLDLDVIAFAQCPTDSDETIVGSKGYKGVLDIENDIRACLQSSNTLGDTVIDVQFEPTVFEYIEFPVRRVTLPIRVLYRQTDNV